MAFEVGIVDGEVIIDRRELASLLLLMLLALAFLIVGSAPPAAQASATSRLVADWSFDGEANGDRLGYAVSTAGDVNGDGRDDLLVGAPKATYTSDNEGVVKLFFGGPAGLDSLPGWQAGSGMKGSLFGAALSAGDFNGDGYGDIVVGAPEYNNGVTKTGAAFAFYGGEVGLPAAHQWHYVSPLKDSNLGGAVTSAGDVDGDGDDEVVVGARWYSNTMASEGQVFLFSGSDAGLSAEPAWSFAGGQAGAGLGSAVIGAGDVNGDGFDDLLVGAPLRDHTLADEGAAYLFWGGTDGLASAPDWSAYGGIAGARLGTAVAAAGDLNGDGFADLAVGAPEYGQPSARGAVFVFYGGAAGPLPGPIIRGDQPLSGFGQAVAGVGDVNGDGYDDLLVGAWRYEFDQRLEGAAFVFFGSPQGLVRMPGWTSQGNKADAGYGFAVAAAGSLRVAGQYAIVIGAPDYFVETNPVGRAFVYYGPLEPSYQTYLYLPILQRTVFEGPLAWIR